MTRAALLLALLLAACGGGGHDDPQALNVAPVDRNAGPQLRP